MALNIPWRTVLARLERPAQSPRWRYLGATFAVSGTTGGMLLARSALGVLDLLLIYLLLAFALALAFGAGPAASGVVLSFLLFDFFFIPPYHTFTVAQPDHVLALFIYLGIAIVTGQLVARVRARTDIAVREQRRTALLYELNAALMSDVTLDAILATIVERVVHVYGARQSRILLQDERGTLTARATFPPMAGTATDRQRLALAEWALAHHSPAGQSSADRRILPPHGLTRRPPPLARRDTGLLYLPIATEERAIGVLEVVGKPGGGRFGPDDMVVLTSFANQAALALERAQLTEKAARAVALAESDELKSALLAAISHDLRTPLAAIKASVTSLLDPSVDWDRTAQSEFLQAINEETDRLTLLVGNLLDLSRIEGGALRPDKQWYDIAELVADVADRLADRTSQHPLVTAVAPSLPLVCFDYVEIAQVLINLVDNAVKYTPPGTPITVAARAASGAIAVTVTDRGPGIPPGQLPHLFERFYRAAPQYISGAGIGLAICKGFIEAHGGRIWVESTAGEGTTIHFTLPLEAAPGRDRRAA